MTIKYGQDEELRKRKGRRSIIPQDFVPTDKTTPEALEARLAALAYQNRAPSVAKSAAAELLERKAPKQKNPEAMLTANDARKITDIYERLFVEQTA